MPVAIYSQFPQAKVLQQTTYIHLSQLKVNFSLFLVYILFFIVTRIEIIWGDNITTSIKTLSESCYKSLAKEDNLIFSPFSVHAILSLVYEAASGKTASHLQEVLNLPNAKKTADDYKAILDNLNSTEKITINLANKIYLPNNFKLKSKFRWTAKAYFNAGVENISFTNSDAAAENINNWVNEKTNNKIQQIFNANDFNDQTKGILLSAIYFKGNWSYSFAKAMTYTEKFYISKTKSISHPMMHMTAPFGYMENAELDSKILKMDYGNKRFAMYIILPNARMGIKNLEKKLSSLDVNHLQLSMMKKVEVAIPKFKIQSTSELSRPLQKVS